jgi:hypothetical protein
MKKAILIFFLIFLLQFIWLYSRANRDYPSSVLKAITELDGATGDASKRDGWGGGTRYKGC